MPLLAKSSFDYGDEFDCECFTTFDNRAEYDEWLESVQRQLDEENTIEHYFGTNEALQINSVEEVEDSIELIEITPEEQRILKKLFGNGSFGTGDIFDIGFDAHDEDEYETEEEDEDFI
jgi:23S rRNA A2030 N6-methylase RlmJ